MRTRIGFFSALTVTAATILFAIGMLTGSNALNYMVSMILSWGYVLLACSFAVEATAKRQSLALGGIAFACVYCVLVCIVYFTQLTTVASGAVSGDLLKMLTYQPGSLAFNVDMLGYAMMALSTFFVGLTIKPENQYDRILKYLLMIHGAFVPFCIILPIANVFGSNTQGGAQVATVILVLWCCYFAVAGVLAMLHYRKGAEFLPFRIVKSEEA
jgi:hypothetical protein